MRLRLASWRRLFAIADTTISPLQFVTQTGGEFTLTPEAKTIADLCSIVQIHRVAEEAEKLATWFGLSERETNWVRTAKAGNEEDGYSEALLGIDEEGWFPFGFGRVSMRRRWLTGKRRQLSMDLLSSLPRWWILNRLTHRTEIWWRATMIEVDAIPDELTSVPQWVCWTERERGGKQTKIPVMPGTASFASVQDPETWASFDAAVETAADDDPVAGIGFVFTEDDPFVGVDLDDCRNAETGEADSWAHEIIEQLDSFTEVSPSGTGYHVYVRGELPDGGNRSGDIECYESARFFTVTGDRVPGTPHDINERTAELADLHAEYIAPSTTSVKGDSSMTASVTPSMDDEDLLEKRCRRRTARSSRDFGTVRRVGTTVTLRPIWRSLACSRSGHRKMRPRWIVYSDNQGSIARSGTNHTIRVGRPTERDGRTGSFGDE